MSILYWSGPVIEDVISLPWGTIRFSRVAISSLVGCARGNPRLDFRLGHRSGSVPGCEFGDNISRQRENVSRSNLAVQTRMTPAKFARLDLVTCHFRVTSSIYYILYINCKSVAVFNASIMRASKLYTASHPVLITMTVYVLIRIYRLDRLYYFIDRCWYVTHVLPTL
jgi:hypothetical protein